MTLSLQAETQRGSAQPTFTLGKTSTSSSSSATATESQSSATSTEPCDVIEALAYPDAQLRKLIRKDDHPNYNRRPANTHLGNDGSAQPTFTLAKCRVRTYHPSCNTFLNLIDDPHPADWQGKQRLRLRAGTRRLGPVLKDSTGLLREPDSDLYTALHEMYGVAPIRYWPDAQDITNPNEQLDSIYRLMNLPSHLGKVEETADDRSSYGLSELSSHISAGRPSSDSYLEKHGGVQFDIRPHKSPACDSCGLRKLRTIYHCNICVRQGYSVCEGCKEKGLTCYGQNHSLQKYVYDEKSKAFHFRAVYAPTRGLRVIVNGKLLSGIGDTGSDVTIVSEERCRELGAHVVTDPEWISLGSQSRMFSSGSAILPVAFPDAPDQVIRVVARVVKRFAFDVLLGNHFLEATQTMTRFIHRFVRCLFSAKNLWSFYRMGETHQRFNGTMADQVPFQALADTGARRNIMRADWALQRGLEIRSEPENCGWITFPDGPDEETIGQVHTWISLPGGNTVPTVFEVLPSSRLPVVLGIDFVLDNNLYNDYASSFCNVKRGDTEDDASCLGMGYKPWYAKLGNKLKDIVKGTSHQSTATSSSTSEHRLRINSAELSNIPSQAHSDTAELKRQLFWDRRYNHGKKASPEERNAEAQRRSKHERLLYADNPTIYLNAHPSQTSSSGSNDPTSSSTSSSNDATGADTEPKHLPRLALAGNREADYHELVHEGGQAWSAGGVDNPDSMLIYVPSFGEVEAEQWQK